MINKSKNQSKSSTKPKSFLRLVALPAALGIALLFITASYMMLSQSQKNKQQSRLFEQAKVRCGSDPVALVHTRSEFFGGGDSYTIYGPLHPDYSSQRLITRRPFGISSGGYTNIDGYFCSIEEAKSARPGSQDNKDNYSAEDQMEMKQEILSTSLQKDIALYKPSYIPAGYSLKLKLTSAYYEYSILSKNQSEFLGVKLGCSRLYTNNLHVTDGTVVGHAEPSLPIYYYNKSSVPIWTINTDTTTCTLSNDYENPISSDESIKIIQSLKVADQQEFLSLADLSL